MITRIEATIDDLLTRVDCYRGTLNVLTFWVPTTSLDEHGMVPANILRARVKHLTKENLGHFSYVTVSVLPKSWYHDTQFTKPIIPS